MLRLLIAAMLFAKPAMAAERTVAVGSFDRVRVQGVFDVRITTARSPRATVSGDPRALDVVEVRVEGSTLTLRRRSATGVPSTGPVAAVLQTPSLRGVAVIGGAGVRMTGMKTERADLSVAGPGTIAVEGVAAEEVNAAVVGTGGITLAGHARHLRLSTNGAGSIDAAKLVSDELTVRLDGPGDTQAQARYTATVSSTGAGRVIVAGKPKCIIRAPAGSDVVCGAP